MADTFQKIASVTVGAGGASSIDFTSIPATYTDLVVKFSLRSADTSTLSKITFNNDNSTSNYSQRRLYGDGSTSASDTLTSLGYLSPIGAGASSYTANTFGNAEMYIPNYAGSTNKSVSIETVLENNFATGVYATLTAGLWSQTSTITSIKFAPFSTTFVQYSTATLYGILKA